MNKFNKSLCSVSIALALSASAHSFADERQQEEIAFTAANTSDLFAQDEQSSIAANGHRALIGQGLFYGGANDNDSSISIVGTGSFYTSALNNTNAEILVDGTDNVSSIEQINTQEYGGFSACCNNWAWAYTTDENNSAAANNTGNNNNILQIGGNNKAASEIQVGSYNTVSVYQYGTNAYKYNPNQSYLKINGDGNALDVSQVGLTDVNFNVVQFQIEGDNNTANIDVKSDGAYLGYVPGKPWYSYFVGNGNTLNANIYDSGISDTWVEFTGDNNTVNILTEGNSTGTGGNAHQIKLNGMVGSGNTVNVESFGNAGNHNLALLLGDDNTITVTNLAGTHNKSIINNLVGSRNMVDVSFAGEGGRNQANVGNNRGDDNSTSVTIYGNGNNITRLAAEGDKNITTANINGSENISKFSQPDHWKWSPGWSPTSGDNNEMIITQSGERNYAAYQDAGNDRRYETVQIGSDNSSLVRGLGDGKEVYVEQIGSDNISELIIDRVDSESAGIPDDYGLAEVSQVGAYNEITVNAKASVNMTIDQTGAFNDVDLSIIGWADEYAAAAILVDINQDGMGNIYEGEIHSAKWSRQFITQEGDDNFVHWEEHAGMQNHAWIDQTGDMNTAYVTLALTGETTQITKVDINQEGSYNEVDLDITGIRNGRQAYGGYTAGIVVSQVGDDNLVVGTDGFGFTINGNDNGMKITQEGFENTASGFIVGNGNQVQMIQQGNNNFASITISAY